MTVEVSAVSLAGLSAVYLRHPGVSAPLSVRVVETPVAHVVERLAQRAHARALRQGRPPRHDLDALVARAEIVRDHDLSP